MNDGLKPCPFCGKEISMDDPGALYPNGIGWKFDEDLGIRCYHNFREVPKEQWCWVIGCPTPGCGCGAEISGDSRDEAIDKWNARVGA